MDKCKFKPDDMCLNVELVYPWDAPWTWRKPERELPGTMGEERVAPEWLLVCCFISNCMAWEVQGSASNLGRCLELAVRDSERASRQGERAWSCRLVLFQSLLHSSIRSPKRWRGVWGGAFPDHSRHSEQSGGKIFKRAVKSSPHAV